jgi:hypothetical protein
MEQGLIILVLEIDEQVKLNGDLEHDAREIWLHLHKKLREPVNLVVDGNQVRIGWRVLSAKD